MLFKISCLKLCLVHYLPGFCCFENVVSFFEISHRDVYGKY